MRVGRIETTTALQLPEIIGHPILATALDRLGGSLAQRVQPEVGTADCHFERNEATTLMDWLCRPGVFFVQMIFWVGLILTGSHVVPEVESGLSTARVPDVKIPFFLILTDVDVADTCRYWRYGSPACHGLASTDIRRLVVAGQKKQIQQPSRAVDVDFGTWSIAQAWNAYGIESRMRSLPE